MPSLIPRGIPWHSRALWHRIGYGTTALWMIAILAITREDVHHPLFKLLFTVPLAGWALGIAAGRLASRYWVDRARSDIAEKDRT